MRPRVFRAKGAWILGWVWLVFSALNAVDLIARGSLPSSLIAGAVLGVLTAVVYVTCLRPGIFLREDGVLVRNPLRDAFVPWGGLDGVRVTHAIHIESGDHTVRSWTPQVSTRELTRSVRAGRRADPEPRDRATAEALANRTHAHWIAEQITEEAVRARARATEAAAPGLSLTWSAVSLSVVAAAFVLVVAALVSAL